MSLTLWYHPFAAYGQKTAVALYELGLPFDARVVDGTDEAIMTEYRRISPFAKMPTIMDRETGEVLYESSIVIEWLDRRAGGGRLMPEDRQAALEARLIDRGLDFYVGEAMGRIVMNTLRPEETRDPVGEAQDRARIQQAWDWLETRLADHREWGAGDGFTLADCGAAPILTYARRLVPFGERPKLRAWHDRLMRRPSFRRALEDAAPYGDLMPAPPPED